MKVKYLERQQGVEIRKEKGQVGHKTCNYYNDIYVEQNNVDNDPDEQQELTDDVDDQNNTSDQGNKSTSTIGIQFLGSIYISVYLNMLINI